LNVISELDLLLLQSVLYRVRSSSSSYLYGDGYGEETGERRKDPRERTARDGETGRTRWRTDESCREQPDSVEEAGLSLHLSLGTSSKVVEALRRLSVP
jgi:hypothetical protein